MNVLPADVAEQMKWCAWRASWHCSNTRKGYKGDAGTDKVAFNDHADAFKMKSSDLLSAETCDNIKWMFWNAAWHTANTRWNYKQDAQKDKERMEEHYQNICRKKELSERLASDLKELGWSAAWYCANTRCGYTEDAKVDKAKFESFSQKIVGEVNLVAVNFFTDQAKMLKEKPVLLKRVPFPNEGDIEQSFTFRYERTEGKTSSWSNTLSFKFGVQVKFEAGFFKFVGGEYQLSLEVSDSQTFSGSSSSSVTKEYTFPLRVPGHSTYVAEATVHEAEMEVPYEMVFDFGGEHKSIYGTWQGVATSTAEVSVKKL